MKEDLKNWEMHIDAIASLDNVDFEKHIQKSIKELSKKKSWINASKNFKYKSPLENFESYTILCTFSSVEEHTLAKSLIKLFLISIVFYNKSAYQQKKSINTDYQIFNSREKSLNKISTLIKELEIEIHKQEQFLNYYSNFMNENSDIVSRIKKGRIEHEGFRIPAIEYLTEEKGYIGFELEYNDIYYSPIITLKKELGRVSQLINPNLFLEIHSERFSDFNLSKLKWYILYQLHYLFKKNSSQQNIKLNIPWTLISDFFDTFYKSQELIDSYPTYFSPGNLQSKFRSSK